MKRPFIRSVKRSGRLLVVCSITAVTVLVSSAVSMTPAFATNYQYDTSTHTCTMDQGSSEIDFQSAIDDSTCLIIDLAGNSYAMYRVTLNRPVTLQHGVIHLTKPSPTGSTYTAGVIIGSSNVILDDLTVYGFDAEWLDATMTNVNQTGGSVCVFIYGGLSDIEINNSTLNVGGALPSAVLNPYPASFGSGIEVSYNTSLSITNTDIKGMGDNETAWFPMYLNPGDSATISGGSFTGPFQYGLMSEESDLTISNQVAFTNFGSDPVSFISSYGAPGTISVTDSVFSSNAGSIQYAVSTDTPNSIEAFTGNSLNGFFQDSNGYAILGTWTSGADFGGLSLDGNMADSYEVSYADTVPGTTYSTGYFTNSPITIHYLPNLPGGVLINPTVPADQTGVTGEQIVISSTTPALSGYTFVGWCTTPDCTGSVIIKPGDTIRIHAAGVTNLYAQWQPTGSTSTNPSGSSAGSSSTVNVQSGNACSAGLLAGSSVSVASSVSSVTGGLARLADGQNAYSAQVSLSRGLSGMASHLSVVSSPVGVELASVKDTGNGNYQLSLVSDTPGIYRVALQYDRCAVGSPITVNFIWGSVGSPLITVGSTQTFLGQGFLAGEMVTITVHSNPIQVATVAADATGQVTASLVIPRSLASGNHTATFTGATSGTATAPFAITTALVSTGGSVYSSTGTAGLAGLLVMAGLAAGALIVRRRMSLAG